MLLEPVQDSILKPVLDDLSLASAFLVWCIVVAWLWRSGWRVQRRYLIEATLTPYRRNGIVWTSAIIGVIAIIASHLRPSAPAIVAVSMIGVLSAITDYRTHRLPNAYTAAMALGVLFGVGCTIALSATPLRVLFEVFAGLFAWLIPLWLLSRLPGGVSFRGCEARPRPGCNARSSKRRSSCRRSHFSFLAAGFAATWRIVVGSAGTHARMPLGPWLIFGAAVSHVIWVFIPDWSKFLS